MRLLIIYIVCAHVGMTNMCDSNKVVLGEHLALFSYYKVTELDQGDGFISCVDTTNGKQIRIGKGIIDDGTVHSTQQFTDEVKVTRTRLHAIMAGIGHTAFRVTFGKQVTDNAVADALNNADISTQSKRRKLVKQAMRGEQRMMHARMCRKDADVEELGRWKVIDLEVENSMGTDKAVRVVDSRTITELIVEGTRYHV